MKLFAFLLSFVLFIAPAHAEDFMSDFGVVKPKERLLAPDFTLYNLKGEKVSLSQLRGNIVLLHFWATWCKGCREEMPSLQKVMEMYGDKGFKVFTINIDRGDKDKILTFMEHHHVNLPVLLDTENNVRKKYEILGLPTGYLIGKDGKFIGKIMGERNWTSEKGRSVISSLLLDSDS
ncbi:MAG: TlpA family protein disulfide reductase [Nitrospinae bacterium]|nr:TlpA family protein disulfide reductase [Nitrospinota bacterium]